MEVWDESRPDDGWDEAHDIAVVARALVEVRVDISTGDTSLTMLAEPADD